MALSVAFFLSGCGGGGGGDSQAATTTGATSASLSAGTPVASTPPPIVSSTPTVLPSGPPAGASCPTTQSAVASGAATQLALGVNRATGVAPLAVFFDASSTTSTGTTRPFHELEYSWSFGESGSGTWSSGAKAGTASRNTATGPIAAHVFESAGTYPITVSATNGTSTVSYSCNITVLDTEAEFVGNKTVCVSGTSNFAGCPVGALQIASSNATTAISSNIGSGNKRILFHRGETFTVNSSVQINKNGPGIVGAYGTGAKPKLLATTAGISLVSMSSSATPSISDWRLVDLAIDGNNFTGNTFGIAGNGSIKNTLMNRVDIKNVHTGISFAIDVLNAINSSTYTAPMWDGFFVVDSTVYNLVGTGATGGNGMYLTGWRMAIMGNSVDLNFYGEHGIRQAYGDKAVYAHNTIKNVSSGRAHLTLRAPSQGGATFTGMGMASPVYTQKLYVGDNHFIGSSAGSGFAGSGPTNAQSTGRAREQVWERNLLQGGSGTGSYFTLHASQITVRNNIALMPAGSASYFSAIATYDGAALGLPNPTDLWFYNNTLYYAGTGTPNMLLYAGAPADGTEVTVMNNLVYAPNGGSNSSNGMVSGKAPTMVVNYAPSNCNTQASEFQTNPNFATTPPTTAAHVKPTTGSYAIGRGTAVPVWSDYFGVATAGTKDIGAVAH